VHFLAKQVDASRGVCRNKGRVRARCVERIWRSVKVVGATVDGEITKRKAVGRRRKVWRFSAAPSLVARRSVWCRF
jgi:hypothetical protein